MSGEIFRLGKMRKAYDVNRQRKQFCFRCMRFTEGRQMRYIFISSDLPRETENILSFFGECVPIPPLASLPRPVAAHPDMQMALLGGKVIIHHENKALATILEKRNIPYIAEPHAASDAYPGDVLLNCFELGSLFFCSKYTSEAALAVALSAGLTPVITKQGYAKCSCLCLHDSIITADGAIIRACAEQCVEHLHIGAGSISIVSYDYGFIGGASGVIDDSVIFFGDINTHPDGEKIKEYIHSKGMNIICAGKDRLFDYGGLVTYKSADQTT